MVDLYIPPGKLTLASTLMQKYSDDFQMHALILDLAPDIRESRFNIFDFEGLFLDLIKLASRGVHGEGMKARPARLFSNGGSAHYGGEREMLHHWMARSNLYKVKYYYSVLSDPGSRISSYFNFPTTSLNNWHISFCIFTSRPFGM